MGLSTAMNTALTGLQAAETQIDVAGNNLANSQTVGFKASDVVFATQFLRTLNLGSQPTSTNGGTNPMQLGLGVQVAEIAPNFAPGAIEASASPSDLAIQGDGFFIVAGSQGEHFYTRNGIFKTNADNELVTATGQRLLGYGVDEFYTLQANQLVPLTIPLGAAAAAQATQHVFLNGNLTPTGDVADTAQVVQSEVLGDASVPRPDIHLPGGSTTATLVPRPSAAGASAAVAGSGSSFLAGDQYEYVVAFSNPAGQESLASSTSIPATIAASGNNVTLSNLPDATGNAPFDQVHVYRRKTGVVTGDPEADYRLVGSAAAGVTTFVDSGAAPGTPLDSSQLNGLYSYLVTFSGPGVAESRPSEVLGPTSVVNGRVEVDHLPTIPVGPDIPAYTTINIYRNLASNANQYYLLASVAPGDNYVDQRSDGAISDLNDPANRELNFNGPAITNATLLTNVIRRNGYEYQPLFTPGELSYTGRKGGNTLAPSTFTITADTTVGDYLQFLTAASGIQTATPGDPPSLPSSVNRIPGESGTLDPGATITSDGRIRLVSNNGTGNAVEIPGSAFQLAATSGPGTTPNLGFTTAQDARGQSASSSFLVYDSLGIPLDVRLTSVLESRDSTETTYRWFADSSGNDPLGPDHQIAVGTGLISFDGEGRLIRADNPFVTILRQDIPSTDPLVFELDFSQVTGFATPESSLVATRQDGSPVGSLTSYSIGERGEIDGVFSNGISRTLGQIRLARFTNPAGLQQHGENLFGVSFNSGLPVEGNPGDLGLGGIVGGALELSNTDTGANLIDLLLASTQYRANSRVISTSQQLLDELLNLRR